MSVTQKSAIFLTIAFVVTWSIVVGAWAAGWHLNPQTGVAALTLSMFGPAIAALICAMAFDRGRRAQALGLHFRPNRWWLAAYIAPIALAAISVALTIVLSGRAFVDPSVAAMTLVEQLAPQDIDKARALEPYLGFIVVAQAAILGALINSVVLTFSEELGWRGYLHGLWRGAGFWRASLGTGVVWGIWHAPAILLFGHNYPENREIGAVLFVAFCILLSPILTFVRDRGASVWASGIFHGTFNAVGALTLMTLSNPAYPWNGIVGIGGFGALALGVLVVAVLQRKGDAV